MLKALFLAVLLIPRVFALPSFSGTVQDNSNGPIDGAKITLWDSATGKGLQTSSSAGRFSLNPVGEGDYLFKVEKDGQMPVYGAIRLAGDSPHEINVVMLAATPQNMDVVGAASALRKALRPVRTSSKPPKVKAARVTKKVKPVYTDAIKRAGVDGNVRVTTIILHDGTLDDLVVLSAPNESLAVAALLAVRQWRYSPTYLDGKAVESSLTIDVDFRR